MTTGRACTKDACSVSQGRCLHTPVAGCCTNTSQCNDQNACTDDNCIVQSGVCQNLPHAACCQKNGDCADGDICTVDICLAQHSCSNVRLPGCCTTDAQCDDGVTCTRDVCDLASHTCAHPSISNCCLNDAQCADASACTTDSCDPRRTPVSTARRRGAARTPATATTGTRARSTAASMAANAATPAVTGCCQTDADCGDGNACTSDVCSPTTHTCGHAAVAGCCTTDAACATETSARSTAAIDHPRLQEQRAQRVLQRRRRLRRRERLYDRLLQHGDAHVRPRRGRRLLHGNVDCNDSDVCTADTCNVGTACARTPAWAAAATTTPTAATGRVYPGPVRTPPPTPVRHPLVAGCCTSNAACADADVCTRDACDLTVHTCSNSAVTGCCQPTPSATTPRLHE